MTKVPLSTIAFAGKTLEASEDLHMHIEKGTIYIAASWIRLGGETVFTTPDPSQPPPPPQPSSPRSPKD